MMNRSQDYIGVFDSGIGGLSVANAIYRLLPQESIYYYADTARVPYGPRPKAEISQFAHEIVAHLLERGAKMIVLACNTATGAALNELRASWPDVPFVGMEPAVKPAATATRIGKVGVLATASTIKSERYGRLMHDYASDIQVWENPCVGLVPLIEQGNLQSEDIRQQLGDILTPMLAEGVDTLVLGCTHYPFVTPIIAEIAGPKVQIIDPAPAVARQVERQLVAHQLLTTATSGTYYFESSGDNADLMTFSKIPFASHKLEV